MEKKEISSKTAIKGLINGFISYGILIMFIFISFIIVITWQINKYNSSSDYGILTLSLPILAAFILFFLIRSICRLSTFDLFKKCKVKNEDTEKIIKRMNIFYIGCIIFSIFFVLLIINVKFSNEKTTIQTNSNTYYSQFSESYAEYLTLNMINEYNVSRNIFLIQSIIIEIGLILGVLSLMQMQKSLIERYNSTETPKTSSTNKNGKHSKEAESSAS